MCRWMGVLDPREKLELSWQAWACGLRAPSTRSWQLRKAGLRSKELPSLLSTPFPTFVPGSSCSGAAAFQSDIRALGIGVEATTSLSGSSGAGPSHHPFVGSRCLLRTHHVPSSLGTRWYTQPWPCPAGACSPASWAQTGGRTAPLAVGSPCCLHIDFLSNAHRFPTSCHQNQCHGHHGFMWHSSI